MLLHYLKVSLRELSRYKTQNVISIVGLAVSLLCFSLCLYCGRYMQGVDTCFEKYERLADIRIYHEDSLFAGTPATLVEHLRTLSLPEAESFSSVVYPRERPYQVEVSESITLPYTFVAMEVDSFYNTLFTPHLIYGSWQVAAGTPNVVILSESTARKVFKDPANALGKCMTLTRRLPSSPASTPKIGGIVYTVQAVIKDLPINTSMNLMEKLDMLTLNDSEGLFQNKERDKMSGCHSFALLREDKKAKELEQHFRKINMKHPLRGEEMKVTAEKIGSNSESRMALTICSWISGIAGMLVLLAGLLNFFHFLIGSYLNRMREYSIRKVNGGGSGQLFSLLFTQSVVLLAIASLLLFCLIELIGPGLMLSFPQLDFVFDTGVLTFQVMQYILLCTLLSAFICAITAFRIRNISVQTGMRGAEKRQGKHGLRNAMLGIQFFICWIFISLTLALYLQSEKTASTLFDTLNKEEKAAIFSIPLNYSFMKNEEKLDLVNRIRQHAGIKEILLSDVAYTKGVSGNYMLKEKDNNNSSVQVNVLVAPSNFFSFMNIPLLSGRTIETNVDMIVDKTFADKQDKEIIGTTLYNGNRGYTACGISSAFNNDVHNYNPGFLFLPLDSSDYVGHCYVKTYPGQEKEVKEWIRSIQRKVLPSNVEGKVTTFQEDINAEQAMEAQFTDILSFFSIVCLIITLLGTYSAITLDTERRRKEVAIRKINGAGIKQIFFLFARLYLYLLVISAALAFPVIGMLLYFGKRAYTVFFDYGFAYWAGIFLSVTLITTVTVLFRIIYTARLNPAQVIKTE